MKNLLSIFTSSAFWTVVAGTVVGLALYSTVGPKLKAKLGM